MKVIFSRLSQEARDKVALEKMAIKRIEAERPLAEQLERARSRIRRYLSYGAGAVFIVLMFWGVMWMAERSILLVGLNTCTAIIFFWFGFRSAKPPQF